MVGLLGCEHIFLAHVQFLAHQYPHFLLGRAAVNPFILQPVLMLRVAPARVQDLALGLVELCEVHVGPLLKPFRVPLGCVHSLKSISCTSQPGVIKLMTL